EGYPRLEAVKKATAQITKAVLGCTATLVIAFLPLVFLPEESGDFIRSLPISIIATVVGSMIVALTVVPFLSTKILKPTKSKEGNVVLQALQKGIHKTYAPLLERGLKYPWITLLIAGLIFGGSLLLIPVVGLSLFPSSEKPQFLININAPLQSNIYYTDSVVRNLEKELKDIPEVNYFTSNVGKGNPQIFYNESQKNESEDFAQIFVQLDSEIRAKEKKEIIDKLRNKWRYFEGSKIEIKDFEQGMPMEAPVEVRILGDNLDSLRSIAGRVEKEIESTEGSLYVGNKIKNLKSDIRVRINKAKAQSLGVPIANIGKAVRTAIVGLSVGSFSDPTEDDDDYDIRLTVPRAAYTDLSIFKDIYVDAIDGNAVPIVQVADFELESSPVSIDRLNKVRMATVTSFVQKGYLNNDVIDKVIDKMDQFDMPQGYHYEMGGEVEGREESFGGFGSVILVAAFMFIAVLILQFGTLKSTVIVLSVIPLGVVGAVVALLIAGESLSFVATIGLIALAGIEVKNTILLVDFTNELRMKGVPLVEAIERASEARFLPIVLTTLTAIGGLTPIAMSSNPLISPLAIVIIGGLISSTLLSRVVTPVVYELIPPRIEVREKEES
ncbi:MAG TPA: efflux RND transporter permease subunit, partial [Flavobacteriaceae bacterium]|nr:efflux RND transporter permease subunit [Flavobacteriaceae bacterium]